MSLATHGTQIRLKRAAMVADIIGQAFPDAEPYTLLARDYIQVTLDLLRAGLSLEQARRSIRQHGVDVVRTRADDDAPTGEFPMPPRV